MCEAFIEKQLRLLHLEKDAEIEEAKKIRSISSLRELQKNGIAVTKLTVSERRTGLLGRVFLTLQPMGQSGELTTSTLSNGHIVAVYQTSDITGNPEATGLVQRISKKEIVVALDGGDADISDSVSTAVVQWTSDVTHKRLRLAAERLKHQISGGKKIVELLLGESEPAPPSDSLPPPCKGANSKLNLINRNLDDSQCAAVEFALKQKDLALIHGPPGTGKTTTVVEIIAQAVRSGAKVLATAPSNVAVDNMVERLVRQKVRVVRVGHPARSEESLQKYSLDAILDSSDSFKIIQDVRADITKAIRDIKGRRKGATENVKTLRKELEKREGAAMKDVLSSADVVLATLTSAHEDGPLRHLAEDHFDYVVVDECSQATEIACWIVLPRAKKVVLAGDPWQLPPTVISTEAAKEGLALSLMERLITKFGDKVTRMLTVQYRMNSGIMDWASAALYDGRLTAHASVEKHLLKDIQGVEDTDDTRAPLVMIDTAGAGLEESEQGEDEKSRANPGEAQLVVDHVLRLVEAGVPPSEIAVVTPYNLQVDTIRNKLHADYPQVEVRSVDGYQGREKEAIVMSMVRSNKQRSVGFLAERRRLNVAVTRARRHFCVVCDAETVGADAFIRGLIEYMTKVGEVRSAFEYDISTEPAATSKPDVLLSKRERRDSEDDQKRRIALEKHYLKTLTDFIQGKETSMSLSRSLSSFERRIVHEVADRLGLKHDSRGENSDRHLVIEKIPNTAAVAVAQQVQSVKADATVDGASAAADSTAELRPDGLGQEIAVEEDVSRETETQAVRNVNIPQSKKQRKQKAVKADDISLNPFIEDVKNCDFCGRKIPVTNMDLHKLQCEKILKQKHENKETPMEKKVKDKGTKIERKKPEKQKDLVKSLDKVKLIEENDDNFDAILEEFQKVDNVCNFKKCKALISLLGQTCAFCNRRFCLTHHMAEIHGCGEEARSQARQKFKEEALRPKKQRPLDSATRGHLQRKLDKKLDEMGSVRKQKPKPS